MTHHPQRATKVAGGCPRRGDMANRLPGRISKMVQPTVNSGPSQPRDGVARHSSAFQVLLLEEHHPPTQLVLSSRRAVAIMTFGLPRAFAV